MGKESAPRPQGFSERFSTVVDETLTPDNINTYADSALTRLIDLSHDIVREYGVKAETAMHASGKDREDAAFTYFDLPSIPETLDHVSTLATEIYALDKTIDNARVRGDVIVPPDSNIVPQSGMGEGVLEHKKVIPRLKTVLLILKKDFNIEIDNPEQLKLQKGAIRDNMMRNESYAIIELPTLNHTVFICDEEGNATYVFHNPTMQELAITVDDLAKLKKSDINELLSDVPAFGSRIIYSKKFVSNIQAALQGERNHKSTPAAAGEETSTYLRPAAPSAPEGVLSITGIAAEHGVAHQTINRIVNSLGNAIGEVKSYRFGAKTAKGFTNEQQEMIEEEFNRLGFASPIPEGALTVNGIAKKYGVDPTTVLKIIEELGDEIGEVKSYRFKQIATGFTVEQQAMIEQKLNLSGLFNPPAPEGVVSVNGVAGRYGVDRTTVIRIIKDLGEDLGEVKSYRFKKRIATGFTPEQQKIIEEEINLSGLFNPPAPEGVVSTKAIRDKFGINHITLNRIVDSLGDRLGSTRAYRFKTKIATGFTPEQQQIIEEEIINSRLIPPSPEGVLSVVGISNRLGVSRASIENIIKSLGAELGEKQNYRFHNTVSAGFSPEQQERIEQEVIRSGLLAPPPPEGVLSIYGIAKKIGIDPVAVKKVIKSLGVELGGVAMYKFSPKTTTGYSPEQQARIEQEVIRSGLLAPPPPEGVLSIHGIAKKIGLPHRTVKMAIKTLGPELGDVETYRFGPNATAGFSPEQITLIENQIRNKNI